MLLLLAVLQGVFEWWPISSSGVVTLVSHILGFSVRQGYEIGLSLHLASGLAVLTLYRGKASRILSETFKMKPSNYTRNYVYALIASVVVGAPLYMLYLEVAEAIGSAALMVIGVGLLVTTIFLLKTRGGGRDDISLVDWVVVGVLQGLAVLPGFSRSGLTIGYLCIRGYKPSKAVEASLLLAIPVLVVAGLYNLVKNTPDPLTILVTQVVVYIVSIFSAKLLIELSTKVKIYWFTLILALLTLIGAILQLVLS